VTADLAPAFLADILADPADRAARLIYADWLDDRRGDDPAAQDRARFIRAQCAAESLDPGDPAWRVAGVEADRLLARHEADWAANVRGLVRAWRFRGGFVEDVHAAPGVLFDAGHRLVGAVPLRGLTLRQAAGGWGKLLRCPLLGRIERLEVNSTFPGGSGWLGQLAASPHLGRLRGLSLARNPLPPDSGTLLGNADLPSLEELTLGRDVTSGGQFAELARTPLARRLVRLDVAFGWNDPGAIDAVAASAWPGVTALTLRGLDYAAFAAGRVAAVPWLGQLRELTVAEFRPPVTSSRFRLDDLPLSDQLESLAITLPKRAGPPPLERWPNLRILRLGPVASDDVLAALAREPVLPRLHTLDLDAANLRGRSLDVLLGALDRSPIRQLSLASAHLGDAEVERLARHPSLAGVQELDLSGVPFGERGVAALLASPLVGGLLRLTLRHCVGVTGQDRRRLQGRFPIVEVR